MSNQLTASQMESYLDSLSQMSVEQLEKLQEKINKQVGASEHFIWKVQWHIDKFFAKDFGTENAVPYEQVDFAENITTNGGVELLWKLFIGSTDTGVTPYNNANAKIFVGSSQRAEAATDTGVVTSLGFVNMSPTFPQVDGRSVVFEGVAGSNECLGEWYEASVTNGSGANAVAINRRVQKMGEKVADTVWTIRTTISGLS